jgi:HAE1 family hydrophobic/amphiphilic exporter-1
MLLGLIVTGPDVESAMNLLLLPKITIPGATEIELSVEDGNPEVSVK